MMNKARSRFLPSALAGKINFEELSSIFRAAEDANMALILEERRPDGRYSFLLTAEEAALYLLDPDEFWMRYFDISPERYTAWRQHVERANEREQVSCLATTKSGRPCRMLLDVNWNPRTYNAVDNNYCRVHLDLYSDLHSG
jgi:hypothetical protein